MAGDSWASGESFRARSMSRRHLVAWMVILVVDAGWIAWGAGAAIAPDHLLGPGGVAILPAGYQGYAHASWAELAAATPAAAGYMAVLYRMYGIFNVIFGLMATAVTLTAFRRAERWSWWTLLVCYTIAFVSAMTYDRTVNAIGPFELSEYVGLALTWGALAVTAPFLARRSQPATAPAAGAARVG